MKNAPITTNGNAVRIALRAMVRSTSPKERKARAELERPKDSVTSPNWTVSLGSSGVPEISGKSRIKNGTKSAAPLIPTVFTTRAMIKAVGNIHQYWNQYEISCPSVVKRNASKMNTAERTINNWR